ncbi:hypothetical protein PIB30_094681 [Stylosanthes scabra]|uniref:Uncharacterized protein n=1 Tax=Stylosanthes scabra TaxID=79078 RepID=A0ABU6TV63_9FABA|nr:hypothetical protein [Stylosanthes scabra]
MCICTPAPWSVRTQRVLKMARNGPSPLAKGKAKAYGSPTRASLRLATLRSQLAANLQPETPVTPTISEPTSSLPTKKHPIQKAAGEGTSMQHNPSKGDLSKLLL